MISPFDGPNPTRQSVWEPGQDVWDDALSSWLSIFRWDYIVTGEVLGVRTPDWQERFDAAIDTKHLFPQGFRVSQYKPSWMPVFHEDDDGKLFLNIIMALPPGSRERYVETLDVVTSVALAALEPLFDSPGFQVRFATLSKVAHLLDWQTELEYISCYVRDHHRCDRAAFLFRERSDTMAP
jgi:hypothetical protein